MITLYYVAYEYHNKVGSGQPPELCIEISERLDSVAGVAQEERLSGPYCRL